MHKQRQSLIVPTLPFTVMRFDVQTAFGLIEAFGGFGATSGEYDVTMQGVRKWAVTGDIQTGWHLRMLAHAWSLGKTVDPRVWGFETSDPCFKSLASIQWLARCGLEMREAANG